MSADLCPHGRDMRTTICAHEFMSSPLFKTTKGLVHSTQALQSYLWEVAKQGSFTLSQGDNKICYRSDNIREYCRLPVSLLPPANEGMRELKEIKEWRALPKKRERVAFGLLQSDSEPCWKAILHPLIRTERSRGTATESQGRKRSSAMKREEVGVRKTAEREGGRGRNGCIIFFVFCKCFQALRGESDSWNCRQWNGLVFD